MKIIIFGIGKFYQNRKISFEKYLGEKHQIVCFLDNSIENEKRYYDNIEVVNPANIVDIEYDVIVIMSIHEKEMRQQLIALGCADETIWSWERFKSEMSHGQFVHYGNIILSKTNRNVLIISTDLDYNGGTIAAVYAAKAIQSNGDNVVLAARSGNCCFIKENVKDGVNITICPAIPYLSNEEFVWIQQFDVVLVNVFQMIKCACMISQIKPTIWWIHEPMHFYEEILAKFPDYREQECISRINIQAVSRIPQKKFNKFYPSAIKEIMPYGIPDDKYCSSGNHSKITFAIVGSVIDIKAQDVFVKAIRLLPKEKNALFLIVGFFGEDEYCKKVRHLINDDERIVICGNYSREQMRDVYGKIDVIVSPSREDSLPIVMTEGMMYGKVCIASDATGTADFIEDGVNGLLCKAGDVESLASKMQWVIDHPEKLADMRKNARKTYEKYFTMEKFAQRLNTVITETIEAYEE